MKLLIMHLCTILSLPLTQIQIFPSAHCSQTPVLFLFPKFERPSLTFKKRASYS